MQAPSRTPATLRRLFAATTLVLAVPAAADFQRACPSKKDATPPWCATGPDSCGIRIEGYFPGGYFGSQYSRWPDKTILYFIETKGLADAMNGAVKPDEVRTLVAEAAALWNVSVIRLQEVQSRPTHKNYIEIVFKKNRCSTTPGWNANRLPSASQMTLSETCANPRARFSNGTSIPRADVIGRIAHEFGHALGLLHEHQRAERDDYLTVPIDVMKKNLGPNQTVKDVKFNNEVDLQEYVKWVEGKKVPALLKTDYDLMSIMHYPVQQQGTNGPQLLPRAVKTLNETYGADWGQCAVNVIQQWPAQRSCVSVNDQKIVREVYCAK